MADKGFYVKLGLKDEQFRQKLNQSRGHLNQFQSSVKTIGPAIAAAFSIAAIGAFFRTSLQGLDQQQKAEAKLLTALEGRADVQRQLVEDATRLQRMTLFGDEATIEAYAQLAIFIKNEQALRRLMPLVQDMATALEMDLSQAAKLVAKSVGSSTNALARYGIELEGTAGSADRVEMAITSLSEKFEGQAAAAANTALGKAQQLQNAWGDFGETLASFVAPALTKVASGLNQVISAADVFLSSKNYTAWEKFRMLFAGAVGDVTTVSKIAANNYTPAIEEATTTTAAFVGVLEEEAEAIKEVKRATEEISTMQSKQFGGFSEANLADNAVTMVPIPPTMSKEHIDSLREYQLELRKTQEVESAFNETHKGFAERMIEVNEQMAQSMSQSFDLIAASFGDAVADFVTGEKTFDEAMKGFANSLIRIAIQLMTTFLAQIIGAAMAHGAAKGGAIGSVIEGGAAAAAFGAMIPALQFLADGGIAYGPTPALIGEYPGASTNPEVVAPLSDLENMIGGGGPVELHGKFRIEGSDLVYIVNKENSKLDRYR